MLVPRGASESLLEFSAWNEIVKANSILGDMKPDVEALLANRMGDAREYYYSADRRVLYAGWLDSRKLAESRAAMMCGSRSPTSSIS
jgi:hypothetical protein